MKAFALVLLLFTNIVAPAQWYSKSLQNFPCKSEGLSMFFADSSLDVGFKNEAGKIIIPASYNWLSPFRNGVAFALKGGAGTCPGYDGDFPHCEGAYFDNATFVLINKKNELLLDDIQSQPGERLLLSTYTTDSKKMQDKNYKVFKTAKGSIGFVDLNKEFQTWYNTSFRTVIEKQDIVVFKQLMFEYIDTTDINQGNYSTKDRMMVPKEDYFKVGKKMPSPYLFADSGRGNLDYYTNDSYKSMVAYKELNRAFKNYVNGCDQFDYGIYPVISFYKLVRYPRVKALEPGYNYTEEAKKYEYEPLTLKFIRTAEGYKVYGISRL